uniref:Arrestin-like N-terminal domain-containing protein n=1 Tax=Kryptolebias marmoratus TaxID=37003 RepID=A0A3Q3FSE6_KRYMA
LVLSKRLTPYIWSKIVCRSTFSSGDVIRGQVSFDLTKETEISSVMMRLRGGASVHWSSSAWKMYRNHYSAEEDYFDHKSALIHEGPGGSRRCSHL